MDQVTVQFTIPTQYLDIAQEVMSSLMQAIDQARTPQTKQDAEMQDIADMLSQPNANG